MRIISNVEKGLTYDEIYVESPTDTTVIGGGSGMDSLSVSVIAAENIFKYDVVTVDGYRADSETDAHRNKILGVSTENIPVGQSGNILIFGYLTNPSWSWTTNNPVFLKDNLISEIPPLTGFSCQIGNIKSASKIFVNIRRSIKF